MRLIPRIGAHHSSPDSPVGAPSTERFAWRLLVALIVVMAVAFVLIFWLFRRVGNADTAARDAQQGERLLYSQAVHAGASPSTTPPGAPPATVVQGARGERGEAGRGITGSFLRSGHLVLVYTDGATVDAGQVVGPRGLTGPTGAAGASGAAGRNGVNGTNGRGITSTQITSSGHLVVGYSDGTTVDLGNVVGPTGANGSNGANGSPGPSGPSGEAGFPPSAFTFTVLGNTYDCTPDTPATAGTQPHYTCTDTTVRGNGRRSP